MPEPTDDMAEALVEAAAAHGITIGQDAAADMAAAFLAAATAQLHQQVLQERFSKVIDLLRRWLPVRRHVTIPDHFIATFYDDLADALGVRPDLTDVRTRGPFGGTSV